MAEYRVTFGSKYRREPHPTFDKAHPDGWVTIVAPDVMAAQRTAFDLLGEQWAFLYTAEEFEPELYPRGELGRFNAEAVSS